ncbi:MAG: hypothetical protein MK116_05490 [Phycisphaerales bacterium]|nr:hypothetical protein [Phycisphaerales bacterium]
MKIGLFVGIVLVILAGSTALLILMINTPKSTVLPVIFTIYVVGEVVAIMFLAFHMLWRPIAGQYPPQAHGEDAITRKMQSFSLGIVNMGMSINATADSAHLHLEPVAWLRFFGASRMSIPWTDLKPHGRGGRSARLGTTGPVLQGPKWCMELVQASEPDEDDTPQG